MLVKIPQTSVLIMLQAHHSFKGYTGLPGRKLQQGPPELLPAVPEMIEPFAAMSPSAEAPMSAPGNIHNLAQQDICKRSAQFSGRRLHLLKSVGITLCGVSVPCSKLYAHYSLLVFVSFN